jgi:hypothetical protein
MASSAEEVSFVDSFQTVSAAASPGTRVAGQALALEASVVGGAGVVRYP